MQSLVCTLVDIFLSKISLLCTDWHQGAGCRLTALTGSLRVAACIKGAS